MAAGGERICVIVTQIECNQYAPFTSCVSN